MRNLAGFREIEDKLLLYSGRHGDIPPEVERAADKLSRQTFGITEDDAEFKWPEDVPEDNERVYRMFLAHESQYETTDLPDEDTVEVLRWLGLDFTDEQGHPLRCTSLFKRQAEAAARGYKGRMPDPAAADFDRWSSSIKKEADAFVAAKRKRTS